MTERTQPAAAVEPELRALQVVRPAAGGMVRHVAVLSAGLRERGIAVSVAGPRSALQAHEAMRLDVDHDLPIAARFNALTDVRSIARLRRLVAQPPAFDVVHPHGLRAAWIAAFVGNRSSVSCIVTAHNLPDLSGMPARVAARISLRRAHAIVAVSQAVADRIAALGADRQRMQVIPNGVPLRPVRDAGCIVGARRALGLPEEAVVLVAVGRLSPEKGYDVLLSAIPRMQSVFPQTILAVVGAGPSEADLAALIARMGLESAVRLVGFVADVGPWLSAADIVVVPSRSEGQGLVALEAMAVGVPVVASRVGGLPEVIKDGVTGLLVVPDDAEGLADALICLARQPDMRQRMGEAGRMRVEDSFSIETMQDRHAALYRSMRKGLQD